MLEVLAVVMVTVDGQAFKVSRKAQRQACCSVDSSSASFSLEWSRMVVCGRPQRKTMQQPTPNGHTLKELNG
ncbi:hypothetical protein MTO96_029962 [Rhipicephalus appendiculatus]